MSLLKRIERIGKKILLNVGRVVFSKFEADPGSVERYKVKRILLIRQDRKMGNLIMTSSLIQAICRVFPQAHLYVLHGRKLEDIFAVNPQITDRFVFDHKAYFLRPWKLIALVRNVRSYRFDIAFDSSHPGSLSFLNGFLTSISGAYIKTGFLRDPEDLFVNVRVQPDFSRHYIENQLNLIRVFKPDLPYIRPVFTVEEKEAVEGKVYLNSKVGSDHSLLAGIWVGARHNKAIAPSLLKEIAGWIGNIKGGKTVFLLGPEEEDFSAGSAVSLRFSNVIKLSAVIKRFDVFISGDTGPMHLAYALGVKTIGIFTQDNYTMYGYDDGETSFVIKPEETKSTDKLQAKITSILGRIRH